MTSTDAKPICCPRCGALLSPFEADAGRPVELCAACKGLWCDEGELAMLLGVREEPSWLAVARRTGTTTSLHCPRCEGAFLRSYVVAPDIQPAQCTACRGEWLDGGTLPRLKDHLLRHAPPRSRTVPPPSGLRSVPPSGPGSTPPSALAHAPGSAPRFDVRRDFSDRFEYDDPYVNGIALPAALLLALLLYLSDFRVFLSALIVNMWLHELGHAALAWWSGFHAVPLPFITFTFPAEKSLLTSLALGLILGGFIYSGLTRGRPYPVILGAVGLVLQLVLTLFVPKAKALEWVTFAGCAGEMVWSTLILISFYYRLPDRIRWDFFRYLALFFGAYGIVDAAMDWYAISRGLVQLPLGSTLGGSDDQGGDMNKLLSYGWTQGEIARTYLGLAQACLALVAVHYAIFLFRALRKARPAG